MLASLIFQFPGMLAAAGAVVVPLFVHWLLRPRPRPVAFPAASLFLPHLSSGQRARRIQDRWLLALRVLLIALAALALAGPSCRPLDDAQQRGARARVIVLDDSWSTAYRVETDRSWFDGLRDAAEGLAAERDATPDAGDAFALIFADPRKPAVELTTDRSAVRSALAVDAARNPHAESLARALQSVGGVLLGAQQPVRELHVYTDLSVHAWRDVPSGVLAQWPALRVRVHAPTPTARTNFALLDATPTAGFVGEGAPAPLDVRVLAGGVPGKPALSVRSDASELQRSPAIELPADAAQDLHLMLPPMALGRTPLAVELSPADRLPFDQARYAVATVSARPTAWLIAPRGSDETNLDRVIYRNLLAPDALPASAQTVDLRVLAGDDAPDDSAPRLIIVLSGVRLSVPLAAAVGRAVESGAMLLLAPAGGGGVDWPQLRQSIARAAPVVERVDPPAGIRWRADERRADDPGWAEFSRAGVRQRIVLADLVEGARIEAEYDDGAAAVLRVAQGRGSVHLLTTSPDPAWSQLGVRAAGLLTWLHAMCRGDAAQEPRRFLVNQTVNTALPGLAARGVFTVQRVLPADPAGTTVRLSERGADPSWPTAVPGVYAVRSAGATIATMYTVNWPAEESDLRVIDAERVRQLLGVRDVEIIAGDAAARSSELAAPLGRVDPAIVASAALIALACAEVLMARRARERGVSAA